MSRLDWFWRRFIVTKLYTQGWGKPEDMKRIMRLRKKLGNRDECRCLVTPDHPVYIDKEVIDGDCRLLDGHFMSPFKENLPGIMPKEVEIARFQMVLPTEWKTNLRPICVHMGGTGDHGFGRRRNLIAKPLLQEEGIASLILENPFYGSRKPKNQFRSSLHTVNDLFIMGGGVILESLVLFNWLDKQGYGPLGATGISLGGHMASLGATNSPKPISLIPCMSGSTAAGVFTHGVLSKAIPWKILKEQYMADKSYEEELKEFIISPEPDWNKRESMYREGRKYFHELEDSVNSDSDSNSDVKEQFTDNSHIKSGKQSTDNYSGTQTASSESIELNIQSTCDSLLENQLTTGTVNLSEVLAEQSCDHKNVPISAEPVCDSKEKIPNSQTSSESWLGSWTNSFPSIPGWAKSESNGEVTCQLELDCKHFMKGVMDECTHLGNFSVPVDPELIIIVQAEHDEYIPVKDYQKLHDIWPGSQLRTLPHGHISGFFMGRKEFRKAIADSFELHAAKYYQENIRRTS